MPKPGEVYCLRCKNVGERFETRDCHCDHPNFCSFDSLGLKERKDCSVLNASKNCNGFEPKED